MPEDSLTYKVDTFFNPIDTSLSSSHVDVKYKLDPVYIPVSTSTQIVLPEEKISEKPEVFNFVSLIFLLCFLIISQIFRKKGRMLSSMLNDLSHLKGRHSIFFATTENELYNKLLLCFQFVLISSVLLYEWLSYRNKIPFDSLLPSFSVIVTFVVVLIIFLLYKWMSYNIVGKVFFDKASLSQWMDNYISLISFSGIILFFPVLISFYVDQAYIYCYYFVFFYFVIIGIVIIYKTYVLFFHNMSLLLYLFLYLCAQEIIPLFLLYKGVVYLFNVVQKNALWL